MKVAIAGYGVEGRANYAYWKACGADITIVDEKEIDAAQLPDGIPTRFGSGVLTELDGFDMVVRTAGLAPHKITTNGKIWSATNEFFAKCPAPIIGVTGTKGKGTVSSFIASILTSAGKKVHLVGNIGTPALDVLRDIQPSDIVVYELSSFQLWDLEKSPHVAVVLMIEPDHLDVHADMDEYLQSKSNIVRWQNESDTVVYNKENDYSRSIGESSAAGNKRAYPFNLGDIADSVKLPGVHNIENASAAIAAVGEYVTNANIIKQGIGAFDGLPHRLKFVREVGGVRYYDDSIATTPGSAIAALRSFRAPKVLILGGSKKGARYEDVVRECAETGTRVIAIGETGQVIAELCRSENVECIELGMTTIQNIVNTIQSIVKPGDVVLLSPASASFDMFKNYTDRGDQFVAAVQQL